jgi:RNA polymerase sigma factor (sigma-70 family)
VTTDGGQLETTLRQLAPRVLALLVRRYGQFEACEDAAQEALLAAAVQWREHGRPEDALAWLVTVGSRRFADIVRSETARREREATVAASDQHQATERLRSVDGPAMASGKDDTLKLLFLCCHPALSPPSQIALTLRAVGGLTTSQIAQAFVVPEATMAQRISRAKQRIRTAGARFELPAAPYREHRLRAVLHALYLIFNEGYTASSGPDLMRSELTTEAIRLSRELHRLLPDDGEVTGLLALMLLTDAHRDARMDTGGMLVPLSEQDRSRWDRSAIAEGVGLITSALSQSAAGPYQLQAAIAAVHAEAPTAEATDWPQIVALYRLLSHIAPSPMVTLNHAAAVAMVDGPQAGLDLLDPLDADERLADHHRLAAVRAHLLEMLGEDHAAKRAYQEAARRTTSLPEQRYLEAAATRLAREEQRS